VRTGSLQKGGNRGHGGAHERTDQAREGSRKVLPQRMRKKVPGKRGTAKIPVGGARSHVKLPGGDALSRMLTLRAGRSLTIERTTTLDAVKYRKEAKGPAI